VQKKEFKEFEEFKDQGRLARGDRLAVAWLGENR
jgi:hypothetical protein